MNIYEIAEEFSISVAKLRKMDKRGILRLDSVEDERCAAIRFYLARNANATVAQLLTLVESPAMLIDLGKFADRARTQVAALGDVKANAAPGKITAAIDDAASGDPDALATLAQWLREVLPAKPVGHTWIAARLLINLPENLRAYNIKKLPMALLNVRNLPEFAGWFSVEQIGTRKQTFYQKSKITLDL